jgi:hypothetical protein
VHRVEHKAAPPESDILSEIELQSQVLKKSYLARRSHERASPPDSFRIPSGRCSRRCRKPASFAKSRGGGATGCTHKENCWTSWTRARGPYKTVDRERRRFTK